jgi:type II restriction enzyme
MDKLIDFQYYPVWIALKTLLYDKSTKKNIIWATDPPEIAGSQYTDRSHITIEQIKSAADVIQPRIRKIEQEQLERTKKKGEVFTPAWICNLMNNLCDEEWFGRKDVFNVQLEASWKTSIGKIEFPKKKSWKQYVDSRRLEITCGEAPYLVSRYDASTGEFIFPSNRIGILDRKLRIVNENVNDKEEWLKWVLRSFQSVYGYEYQGDNLLLARVNLLMTFVEYYTERWNVQPEDKDILKIANVIAWNLWQMDGLKDTVPFGKPYEEFRQMTLFELWGEENMESYKIADVVEMIHPARFLFNAGSTPKQWNEKMLQDSHLKVKLFEQDSSKIFSGTDIKGGVAITYRDEKKEYGAIRIFTPYEDLNAIVKKVNANSDISISSIVITRTAYRLTPKMHEDHPEAIGQLSKGHAYDMSTNIFERLPQIFFEEKPADENEYIQMVGREGNERVYRYIRRDYVNQVCNLDKFKVLLPKANGSGALGEVLSAPIVAPPSIGSTETFLSIGAFETKDEADAVLKYIKTKFVRILLGVLKTTQDITPDKWKMVPMQDFTGESDIDWSMQISDIDRQLYQKYSLSENEIRFIETNAKEMA